MKTTMNKMLSRIIIIAAMLAGFTGCSADNAFKVPSVEGFDELDKFAKAEVDQVGWPDSFPYAPEVKLAVAHTDDRLLIRFDVTEDNVKATVTENNGPVCTDSCCEFFVQIPGDDHYFNFETNCIGTCLASRRLSISDYEDFDEGKMAKVIRRTSLPRETVDIKGRTSWWLELEVPFEVLGLDSCPETLMANFYKCGDKTDKPHYLSWNKVGTPKPNFHTPEFFREISLR